MKKLLFGVLLLSVMLVVGTGFKEDPVLTDLQIGTEIPEFSLRNSYNTLEIGVTGDKYTLITFWDSFDAEGRMACNKYNELLRFDSKIKESLRFAAINLDSSETIYQEIVINDNLDTTLQYHPDKSVRNQLIKLYGLDKGYGSVLISPKGKIVAFNPSTELLCSLEV